MPDHKRHAYCLQQVGHHVVHLGIHVCKIASADKEVAVRLPNSLLVVTLRLDFSVVDSAPAAMTQAGPISKQVAVGSAIS